MKAYCSMYKDTYRGAIFFNSALQWTDDSIVLKVRKKQSGSGVLLKCLRHVQVLKLI